MPGLQPGRASPRGRNVLPVRPLRLGRADERRAGPGPSDSPSALRRGGHGARRPPNSLRPRTTRSFHHPKSRTSWAASAPTAS